MNGHTRAGAYFRFDGMVAAVAAGNNKCAGCGQWSGKGHKCPTTATLYPSKGVVTRPIVETEAEAVSGEQVSERLQKARAMLLREEAREVARSQGERDDERGTGGWNWHENGNLDKYINGYRRAVIERDGDRYTATLKKYDDYHVDEDTVPVMTISEEFGSYDEAIGWVTEREQARIAFEKQRANRVHQEVSRAVTDGWRPLRYGMAKTDHGIAKTLSTGCWCKIEAIQDELHHRSPDAEYESIIVYEPDFEGPRPNPTIYHRNFTSLEAAKEWMESHHAAALRGELGEGTSWLRPNRVVA